MEIDFNLNHDIKVKLTDKGYQKLADLNNEFLGIAPNGRRTNAEYYKNLADKDGYLTFQAWEFMKYFGTVTGMNHPDYFDYNIILYTRDKG